MAIDQSNTEDLRIQRTKHLLREAIAKLLEVKELKDISIQQISKKAMIYRTTFYSHYSDKYDLLEDYLIESWKAEINFERTADTEQIKEVYWDGVLDTVKFFKNYSKLFIQLNENKSIISKQNVIYNTIKQSFMLLLNVLQPDNKKIKVAKEKIAEFYTSGYLSIIFSWLLTGLKETCEAITKELIIMTNQNLIYLLDSKGVS